MLVEGFLEGLLFFEEGFVLGKLQVSEMFSLVDLIVNTVRVAG
jgi:hypothetical protein